MAIPSSHIAAAAAVVYCFFAVAFLAGVSNARDLRPSEHGLEFQNPTASSSPGMQSFFRGNSWPSSEVALPKAINTSLPQPWWNRSREHRSGAAAAAAAAGGDHIRRALLVASLVCGSIGVSLLIASAFIYFFKFRKQSCSRSSSSSSLSGSETANIIDNK